MLKENKKGFTIMEMMIVIVILGILYTVISSTGFFAVDKASDTAVLVDMGIYEIAISDAIMDKEINNLDILCSAINSSIDMQFRVQIIDNHLESISKENKNGERYKIYTDNFSDYTLKCGEVNKNINVDKGV